MVIRILIVDDHPVFRAGIMNLLALEPDFAVVGQAPSGEAAMAMLERHDTDVVLLDLSMQGMGGFETLRRMRTSRPDARVIVLTSSEAVEDAGRAFRGGAEGYLTKLVDHSEIVAAIRDVHAGRKRFPRGCSESLTAPAAEPACLTPREIEVLSLARKAASNAEIGMKLGITVRTVKAHMTSILEKLGASDRAGALMKAFELGILTLPPKA